MKKIIYFVVFTTLLLSSIFMHNQFVYTFGSVNFVYADSDDDNHYEHEDDHDDWDKDDDHYDDNDDDDYEQARTIKVKVVVPTKTYIPRKNVQKATIEPTKIEECNAYSFKDSNDRLNSFSNSNRFSFASCY